MKNSQLLEVKDLSVSFISQDSSVDVVDSVSFKVHEGQTIALVGESGCGKSVTAASVMRLLPHPQGVITGGNIKYRGENLLEKDVSEMYKIRGGSIAMIFQEPMTAMNPVHMSGKQIREVLQLHRNLSKGEFDSEIITLLEGVEMPSPGKRVKNYPFQLSGGMRQRMMIAMALAGEPDILIADEPTTALDVTVQAQILKLIKSIQKKRNMGVIFITHDMGVVSQVSDEVAVMYAGQIVEKALTKDIFNKPMHPYTIGLINSIPGLNSKPKTKLTSIRGSVPSPKDYGNACRFAPRCQYAIDKCYKMKPEIVDITESHTVMCLRVGEINE